MERQKENGHSGVLVSFLNWVKYFLFGYFYIVAVDYGMKPRENTPFYCMLLFLFMVLSFWGKQKIRRLLPFLFYQAVVVCGCTFIGRDSEERVYIKTCVLRHDNEYYFSYLQHCSLVLPLQVYRERKNVWY